MSKFLGIVVLNAPILSPCDNDDRCIWNTCGMEIGRRKLEYSYKTFPQCHFVHYKFNMDCQGLNLGLHGEVSVCGTAY